MRARAWLTGLLLVAGCNGEIGDVGDVGDTMSEGAAPAPDGAAPAVDGAAPVPEGAGPAAEPANDPPARSDCAHVGSGKDYQVGPGKEFEAIGDVPLESLAAGDTVRIFWRPAAYHEKIMIGGQGTADQPIRICGVPGPGGELPVIDGEGATTRPELDFPFDGHQVRGLVIIGHKHDDPYHVQPSHITIEGLEIRNASPPFRFTDKAGAVTPYARNAAGIFVERGEHVTIRGCDVHDNANGLFIGTGGAEIRTKDVLIESNHVHDNGSPTDYTEHNVYNEATNVVYQFNRFGPTRGGGGNNIKERSAGVVIRYNWIEGGAHLIDLVDAQEATDSVDMPSFHETFVYGNVLLRTGYGPSMVHYGGDSGQTRYYRKGTLRFFANTVFVDNATYRDYERSAVFEASTNDERIDARNNVFASTEEPTAIRAITFLGDRDNVAAGTLVLTGNWVMKGWTPFDPVPGVRLLGKVEGLDSSIIGLDPAFASAKDLDFVPATGGPLVGAGAALDGLPAVDHEYAPHLQARARDDGSKLTIGAFGL
ncbi:right-handed parallel beta-helix repeat-containing protein [Sorangium sp. So ce854]|uniref:right-handed parallel beta-helix repeat-containing protein n=1 Tax=Sorangium sp. So ce854 TaxID=3133322 RepID=UPI003F5E73B6